MIVLSAAGPAWPHVTSTGKRLEWVAVIITPPPGFVHSWEESDDDAVPVRVAEKGKG